MEPIEILADDETGELLVTVSAVSDDEAPVRLELHEHSSVQGEVALTSDEARLLRDALNEAIRAAS